MSVIVLIGFMGAGKTTVGRILAAELGYRFIDSDLHIEGQQGRTVREIFATEGEAAFRELEHRSIAALTAGSDTVLAVGGGAAEHALIRLALNEAIVVYLHVDYTEALSRVGGDGKRPMLQRGDLAEIYRNRLVSYRELASITVDTGRRAPSHVAREIVAALSAG